jgi:transcriptional regulator with XRE-family HTH domain
MAPDLDQDELRRRFRAARALRGWTIEQLAEHCDPAARLSPRSLYRLDGGETALTPPILKELADTLDVSRDWFTVPDLAHAIDPDPTGLRDEVAELRESLSALWAAQEAAAPPAHRGSARFAKPRADGQPSTARKPRPRRQRSDQ